MTDFSNQAAEATERMRQLFPATPLQRNDHLSNVYDADIWLKREDLSPVRSYKLRGAFNAMGKQADKDVFVCASAGNHAQGVAYVCRHLQKKGVIFMPVTTPEQKIRKTRLFGGAWVQVQLVGDYFDDTLRASQAYCAEVGGHFLSPFDDPDVIEGQATVTYEMLEQLGRSPDVFVVPVGGGGLSSSARRLLSERAPETEIFYVEPSGGKSLAAAVQAGAPIALEQVDTFVDGAAVAKMGVNTFAALKGIDADHVLDIPEDRICTTILDMLNTEGIVLEPPGALALDALKDLKDKIKGKTVVCVSSGGNFDFEGVEGGRAGHDPADRARSDGGRHSHQYDPARPVPDPDDARAARECSGVAGRIGALPKAPGRARGICRAGAPYDRQQLSERRSGASGRRDPSASPLNGRDL